MEVNKLHRSSIRSIAFSDQNRCICLNQSFSIRNVELTTCFNNTSKEKFTILGGSGFNVCGSRQWRWSSTRLVDQIKTLKDIEWLNVETLAARSTVIEHGENRRTLLTNDCFREDFIALDSIIADTLKIDFNNTICRSTRMGNRRLENNIINNDLRTTWMRIRLYPESRLGSHLVQQRERHWELLMATLIVN